MEMMTRVKPLIHAAPRGDLNTLCDEDGQSLEVPPLGIIDANWITCPRCRDRLVIASVEGQPPRGFWPEDRIPICPLGGCGSPLRGLDDHEVTIRRAELGELKGFCPRHDWQNITLGEQHTLADIARKKLIGS
jgi:hypothetical protein